jgi:hypothetical protein
MKNFVKALDTNGTALSFFCEIFFGPQTRQLFRGSHFDLVFSVDEKEAGNGFRYAATGFLGNLKVAYYWNLVENLIMSYGNLGYICHSRCSSSFPGNSSAVSDENREYIHQDTSAMENMYKGKGSVTILADYCRRV